MVVRCLERRRGARALVWSLSLVLVLVLGCAFEGSGVEPPAPEGGGEGPMAAGLLVPAALSPLPPDRSAQVFDPSRLHEIRLEVEETGLARLRTDSNERVPATLAFDGVVLERVGLRLKRGGGSRRELYQKAGFTIDIDHHVAGQTLHGVSKLSLGNAVQDHSFVAESLSYEIFRRAGLVAPRTCLARVYLRGVYYGLYVVRESYDANSLRRHFAGPQGDLYEGRLFRDLVDLDEDDVRAGRESSAASAARARLAEVVRGGADDALVAAVAAHVDLDWLLRFWAVEALVYHLDGYAVTSHGPAPCCGPNNYYVYYHPAAQRFLFLPHGADLTLGNEVAGVPGVTVPVLRPPGSHAALVRRLYDLPEIRERLRRSVLAVLAHWDMRAIEARALQLAAHVREDGLGASFEEADLTTFEDALAHRVDFLRRRPEVAWRELIRPSEVPPGGPPAPLP